MRKLRNIAVLFAALLLAQPLHAAVPKETKRVLILYSLDKWHPAHNVTEQAMRKKFRENSLFDIHEYAEYLDLGRFHEPEHARAMAEFLRRKYAAFKIDVVVTVYPDALDFLLREKGLLFSGVPIVAAEVTKPYAENLERSPARRRVTAAVLPDNASAIIADVLRLKPDTLRFALVGGSAPVDAHSTMLIRSALKTYAGRFELIDLTKLSMPETLARVGVLPEDTVVLYGSIVMDGSGQSFVPRDALALVSKAANAPVFGLYDSLFGYGIVGGHLMSFEREGEVAAELAMQIMSGASPGDIPVAGEDAYVDLYDARELKRWGIPASVIPEGSELRYHVPSFVEAHPSVVVGTVSLVIFETALILGLLFNIQQRRRAERSLRDSEERVRLSAEAAGAGLWSLDRDGRSVWATDRSYELYGLTKDDPKTLERVLQTVYPEDRGRVRSANRRAWETGAEIIVEYRLVLPDGALRWLAVRMRVQRREPGQAQFLMGATVDITVRKQSEEALRNHEQELTTLAGRLIHNQEEELRRLSRELHDDLTQRLTVLAIDAGMLEKTLQSLHPSSADEVRELKEKLIDVSNEVHQLSRRLHPSILDDLGLVQAVRAECDTFRKRTGIALTFEAAEITAPPTGDAALCLYRVLQEALQNIAKHSRTSEAHASIEEGTDCIRLTVQDFGAGFDMQQASKSGGIGLTSMRERVRLVSGKLTIATEPGKGTAIQVILPRGGAHYVQTADSAGR
jgi:PAS domain S-box-containing protein